MQCPKCQQGELQLIALRHDLNVQCCSHCHGMWIPPEVYAQWRHQQPLPNLDDLPKALDVDHSLTLLDSRAALCPDCGCFFSRAKVGSKRPFYVERCPKCEGLWCDRGEWDVLEQMGLHTIIDQLFTSEWQTKIRQRELAERERQATMEKLGEDLALRVFELAELLEKHPNGDFGVAYLMRRFDKT